MIKKLELEMEAEETEIRLFRWMIKKIQKIKNTKKTREETVYSKMIIAIQITLILMEVARVMDLIKIMMEVNQFLVSKIKIIQFIMILKILMGN